MPKVNLNSLDFDSDSESNKKGGKPSPKKMKNKEVTDKKKPKK